MAEDAAQSTKTWSAMVERSLPADYPAFWRSARAETAAAAKEFQRLHAGARGDVTVAYTQKVHSTFLDLDAVQRARTDSALLIMRQLDARLAALEERAATMVYRGTYAEGEAYVRGDMVTWGGSLWHCNEPTTEKPGEGSKAWTLAAKRGRDGKDAPGARP